MALLTLCLADFVIQLDVTIVNVALSTIQHELQVAPGSLEWIISGYALGLAALIPLVGALGDRCLSLHAFKQPTARAEAAQVKEPSL